MYRKSLLLAGWITLAILPLCAQQPTLHLEREIALPGVEGRLDHLSVDLAGQRIFLSALGNDTVEVVDLRTGRRAAEIHGLKEPQGVLYVAASHTLYVANGGDGSVRSYDGLTLKPLKSVMLGEDADNLRYDPVHQQVLAAYGTGAIAVLSPALTRRANLATPVHPESFQIAADGRTLYVNLPGNHSIARADLQSGSVQPQWSDPGAGANFPMALDPDARQLFVACRQPAQLVGLNAASGAVAGHIATAGDADDLFYDAQRKALYVIGGEGYVDVVTVARSGALKSIGHLQTGSGARTGLYVPEWNKLFVAAPLRGSSPARLLVFAVGP